MWNKNERKGKVDQAKGKVKQAVGTLTDTDELKAEGQGDKTVGKVEAAAGRTSPKTGDAITRVGKAVKRWQADRRSNRDWLDRASPGLGVSDDVNNRGNQFSRLDRLGHVGLKARREGPIPIVGAGVPELVERLRRER
jgi:uncharacterized protein YjbJ (UPF0337 family)